MAKKKNFNAKKRYKNKYSAAEKRAYYIGLGRGARVVSGSGKELESFKRGVERKAKVELSKC